MELNRTRLTEMLIQANGFDSAGFTCWAFHPGMLFNSTLKWWGGGGLRDFPHEGIDLCLYQDASGGLKRLGSGTLIPVLHDGVVRGVFSDYLGRTLLVEHEGGSADSNTMISFYAHIRPLEGIRPGVRLKRGDPLAVIADTHGSKARILPHLHYSLGRASAALAYDGFVWDTMRNPEWIRLRDPLALLDWPHRLADPLESDPEALFNVPKQ